MRRWHNTDACVVCNAASCGDSFVQIGVEVCADGNVKNRDGCSSMCMPEDKIVFVTSTVYTGDFGGLFGSDAICICNVRAQAAKLPGSYMAWLSTGQQPASRSRHSPHPEQGYRRVWGSRTPTAQATASMSHSVHVREPDPDSATISA